MGVERDSEPPARQAHVEGRARELHDAFRREISSLKIAVMENVSSVADEILALERAALDRWGNGDPSGFLEISAPDVTYFDPFLDRRIDGLDALSRYYEGIRGKIRVARDELLHPTVVHAGDMAVLSFQYVSFGGNEDEHRWNCTEVYRREPVGWRIVQTHWSFTKARR